MTGTLRLQMERCKKKRPAKMPASKVAPGFSDLFLTRGSLGLAVFVL